MLAIWLYQYGFLFVKCYMREWFLWLSWRSLYCHLHRESNLHLTQYTPGTLMKSAAVDVINHNGRKFGRFWADVILADFQKVISRYLQDISTYLSCTVERVLRTILMQKSSRNMHVYPTKSSRFEPTDFESVMIDDVGCSRHHQCPRCDSISHKMYHYNKGPR